MYKCKHFSVDELVPPHVYKERGSKAWELLDERLLITIDELRDALGSAVINNYRWGGNRQWSGLRTPESPYYRPYSQHSFGRAVDMVFAKVTAEEARQHIFANKERYPYVFAVELGVSWLHIDCRNTNRIFTFEA